MSPLFCRGATMLCACLLVPGGSRAEERKTPAEPARAPQGKARAAQPKARSASSPTRASDPIRKGTESLLEIERKLRELEAGVLQRRSSSESRLSDLEFEKQVLERETQALSGEVADLEKSLTEKKEALSRAEGEASGLAGEARQTLDAVRRFLARIEKHIDEGIPWAVEARKKAVQQVRDTISRTETTPARALALAARAHEAEEALSRGVEPGRVTMEIAGERQSIPAFRLGLLSVVYLSEDGAIVGCAQPGQSLEQGRIETGSGGEDSARKAIGKVTSGYDGVLEILRRRLGPRVVDVYLPSLPVGSGEGER